VYNENILLERRGAITSLVHWTEELGARDISDPEKDKVPNGSPEKLINKSAATSPNKRITLQKKPAGRSTLKESAKKEGYSVGRGKRKQIKDHEGNHHDLFTFECLSRQTLDPHLWFELRPPHTFLEYFIGYVQLRKQIYMTLN